MTAERMTEGTSWSELTANIVRKCELAVSFGLDVRWDTDGADALGKLIKEMSAKLDEARAALAASNERGGKEDSISS